MIGDECDTYDERLMQLWKWVGERKYICLSQGKQADLGWEKDTHLGSASAYSNVRLYMRKFFSGLIDFDDEGETDGN